MGAQDAAGQAEPRVAVRIRRPSPELQGYVTFFYFVDVDGPLTDFLYPEWGNVRFALRGRWTVAMGGEAASTPHDGALFGPTDRPGMIATEGGRCAGFGLTPIGWHRLVGGDASAMANRVAPLDRRLGFDTAAVHAALLAVGDEEEGVALLERLIAERLATRPQVSAPVLVLDRALRTRPAEVGDLAHMMGVSERTLSRMCCRVFGFAPKRLLRLQRFLDTLGHVRSAIGGAVGESIEGYFDQAHFYRDFRDFMGMSPRSYFGAPRLLMAAAAAEQQRAGVSLSFRLPPPPGEPIAPPEGVVQPLRRRSVATTSSRRHAAAR